MIWFFAIWWLEVRNMVFNATFNNISVISWSVLSVDDTRIPGEKEKTTDLLHVNENFIT
jgi:hypothetical protein